MGPAPYEVGKRYYRLIDEGDRVLFMEYVYQGETKHHVDFIVGIARTGPRRFLKTDSEVQRLFETKQEAIDAETRRRHRRLAAAEKAVIDRYDEIKWWEKIASQIKL